MERYKTNLMQAFKRAAAKPEGRMGSDFLEAVLRERPDLQGQRAYFPAQGECGHVVFIGDEVFKGPQDWMLFDYKDQPVGDFDKEHETLSQLQGCGLPVPRVTCVGRQAYFYGMTRMPGVTLTEAFKTMTDKEKRDAAFDIADFMIGMAKALPPQDGMYACQEDLHGNNVLIDPKTKRLAAVIDFGVVSYASREDLARCVSWSPLEFYVRAAYKSKKAALPDHPAVVQQKQDLPKPLDVLEGFTRMSPLNNMKLGECR